MLSPTQPMESTLGSREDALRRALIMAIPVGSQLGGIGLESIGRAASVGLDCGLRLATWTLSSAVRTASAGLAFANRNVLAPAANLAFGSQPSSNTVRFCTQTCPQLVPEAQGRKHTMSRTASRLQRAASKLRSGSAKCSMRKQHHAAAAAMTPILLAHLAAACALAPSSDAQEESSFGSSSRSAEDAAVAQWTVNTLGLQSSML